MTIGIVTAAMAHTHRRTSPKAAGGGAPVVHLHSHKSNAPIRLRHQTCMAPVQARHLVDRACRVALNNRTVATIILPEDVAMAEAEPSPPRMHGAVFSSVGWTRPTMIPPESEVKKAAEILNADKDIPAVLPHIKKEMAKKTAKAVMKDPDRVSIATKGAKQKMHEFTESLTPSSRMSPGSDE